MNKVHIFSRPKHKKGERLNRHVIGTSIRPAECGEMLSHRFVMLSYIILPTCDICILIIVVTCGNKSMLKICTSQQLYQSCYCSAPHMSLALKKNLPSAMILLIGPEWGFKVSVDFPCKPLWDIFSYMCPISATGEAL